MVTELLLQEQRSFEISKVSRKSHIDTLQHKNYHSLSPAAPAPAQCSTYRAPAPSQNMRSSRSPKITVVSLRNLFPKRKQILRQK